jgi:sulfoacetaldehyde acetyltransferase
VSLAAPERPAVAYIGDGAFGMSVAELMTSVRERIPMTAVVFNNVRTCVARSPGLFFYRVRSPRTLLTTPPPRIQGQWGAEKKNMVLWFDHRYTGTELGDVNYTKIAQSFGAEGIRVSSLDQVGDALRKGVANQAEVRANACAMRSSPLTGAYLGQDDAHRGDAHEGARRAV